MSADNINELCELWATLSSNNLPFANKDDLHETIDATMAGNIPPWQCFYVSHKSKGEDEATAPWKVAEYPVYFHDPWAVLHMQLANPDFKSEMDFTPKQVYNQDDKRTYKNLMSGNWAWHQAVSCSKSNCLLHSIKFV